MIELSTLQKLNLALQANTGLFLDLAYQEINEKDVILLRGEYKNRMGRVEAISINNMGEFIFLIHPYKLNNKGERTGEFLNDRPDARSYWKLKDFKII